MKEFSFMFCPPIPDMKKAICLYCIENISELDIMVFHKTREFDGFRYDSTSNFSIRKAHVGNMYCLITGNERTDVYYIVLDEKGKLSESMEFTEILEHFKFVEAST